MENQESKTKIIRTKSKKLVRHLWPFAKKEKPVYNLKTIKIPRTTGRALKILVMLIRTPGIRMLLIPLLLRQAGLPSLRKSKVEDNPVMEPFHPVDSKINSADAKKINQAVY